MRTWALIGLILAASGTNLRAQDVDIVEVEPEAANLLVAPVFEINQANFDQWIYGNRLQRGTATEYLDSILRNRVAEVDRACGLSDGQRQQLQLAGHMDIKRFNDRVAEVRADFERLRRDQARMNDLFQQTVPLATALNVGLYGEGSIFGKSIASTLAPEQVGRYRAAARAKLKYRWRAKILLALANLDATIGLSSDQVRRYTEAILDATDPPDRPAGQYENQVVLLLISRVPEDRVRPIFDEGQWQLLQQQLAQARGMEPFLRANGFLPGGKAGGDGSPSPPPRAGFSGH